MVEENRQNNQRMSGAEQIQIILSRSKSKKMMNFFLRFVEKNSSQDFLGEFLYSFDLMILSSLIGNRLRKISSLIHFETFFFFLLIGLDVCKAFSHTRNYLELYSFYTFRFER